MFFETTCRQALRWFECHNSLCGKPLSAYPTVVNRIASMISNLVHIITQFTY